MEKENVGWVAKRLVVAVVGAAGVADGAPKLNSDGGAPEAIAADHEIAIRNERVVSLLPCIGVRTNDEEASLLDQSALTTLRVSPSAGPTTFSSAHTLAILSARS